MLSAPSHAFTTCSLCRMSPIVGWRLHCVDCSASANGDTDFCEHCFRYRAAMHDRRHTVNVIVESRVFGVPTDLFAAPSHMTTPLPANLFQTSDGGISSNQSLFGPPSWSTGGNRCAPPPQTNQNEMFIESAHAGQQQAEPHVATFSF